MKVTMKVLIKVYSDNENDNENDNKDKKYTYYNKIKELNNWFETIDQTKSLADQIEISKTKNKNQMIIGM